MTKQNITLVMKLLALEKTRRPIKLNLREAIELIKSKLTKTDKQTLIDKLFFMEHISEPTWESLCDQLKFNHNFKSNLPRLNLR